MNVKEAIRLVFSKRARLEHSAWDAWARDEINRRKTYVAPQPVVAPRVDEDLAAEFEAFKQQEGK